MCGFAPAKNQNTTSGTAAGVTHVRHFSHPLVFCTNQICAMNGGMTRTTNPAPFAFVDSTNLFNLLGEHGIIFALLF
jgi:hypothetical protein